MKSVEDKTSQYCVSPLFQLILVVISVFIISGIIYHRLALFKVQDREPKFSTITPEKFKKFGEFPATIEVGLLVDQFQSFDIINNIFMLSGILWFKFDPGRISIDTLSKFKFRRGEILEQSLVQVQLVDNQLIAAYDIKVRFSSALDYTYFPLDNHRIFLMLVHPPLSTEEAIFESSEQIFSIKPDIRISGWNVTDLNVKTGYIKYSLDSNNSRIARYDPITLFIFDFTRIGIRYTLSILMPLLLIIYLMLFSFSIIENVITLSSLGITALISYRFVIENMSPAVGYFMASDLLFFLFLVTAFFIFFAHIVETYTKTLMAIHKKIIVIFLHLFIVSGSAYILLLWT